MTYNRQQRWVTSLALALTITGTLWACSSVPRRYIWIAEPGVTLTMLSTHQQSYVGKVVLLGGTIIEQEDHEQFVLLRLKNRPLDQDYKPHRPADTASSEGGFYWVMMAKGQVPLKYQGWARATVVGRVTGEYRLRSEPVLTLLYMRGWGASGNHAGVWENIDPNYVPGVPGSIDMRN